MQNKWFKVFLKALNLFLTVGVFYFAYVYGKSLFEQADFTALQNNWWILALAVTCFLAFYTISAVHWLKICRIVAPNTNAVHALAYLSSQPYKYLPTSIFAFSYRAKYSKQLGMPLKESSYAQLIENFNILGSGLVVSVSFLAFYWQAFFGLMCVVVFGLAVYFALRTRLILPIPLTKGKRSLHVYKLIPSFCLMIGAWVMAGIAFWLVNDSLDYSMNLWLIISANAAAFVVSILAIFAPGGLGVRELTLSLFAVHEAPIVLWRLLTFGVDMVVGISAVIVIRLKQK